jgi:hypothetical protein
MKLACLMQHHSRNLNWKILSVIDWKLSGNFNTEFILAFYKSNLQMRMFWSDFKTGESSILNAYPQTYSLKSYFCCNILLIHAWKLSGNFNTEFILAFYKSNLQMRMFWSHCRALYCDVHWIMTYVKWGCGIATP